MPILDNFYEKNNIYFTIRFSTSFPFKKNVEGVKIIRTGIWNYELSFSHDHYDLVGLLEKIGFLKYLFFVIFGGLGAFPSLLVAMIGCGTSMSSGSHSSDLKTTRFKAFQEQKPFWGIEQIRYSRGYNFFVFSNFGFLST